MDEKPERRFAKIARHVLRMVLPPVIGMAVGVLVVGFGYFDSGLDSDNPVAARRLYVESVSEKLVWWVSIGLFAGIAFAGLQFCCSRKP